MENKILQGSALEVLKTLPEKSINMCMTSPPYWALRDYGVNGQLGLESTFDKYISDLCDIFDGVRRVLRDDGTCWVNIGDTYSSGSRGPETEDPMNKKARVDKFNPPNRNNCGISDKCLIMIPFRFAMEMVNRGWILRNTIIWHKRNCMPSSASDRFTVDFEYLFFFSKKKKYYFKQQIEPMLILSRHRAKGRWSGDSAKNKWTSTGVKEPDNSRGQQEGRNKRTTWTINPKPFKEAHFAVYPEELCETPIKAGCPEYVCKKCGEPRESIREIIGERVGASKRPGEKYEEGRPQRGKYRNDYKKTLSDCGCNLGFTTGIVLDPFFGSGTTGLVALKQDKKFIGIELNQEYIKIANERLRPFLLQTKLDPLLRNKPK